jgi:Bacteriophage head to tail connecting protein
MNARVDPAVSLAEASDAPYTHMSPSLLSQQPVNAEEANKARDLSWWSVAYVHLEARLTSLRTGRWSWWVYWVQLWAFFQPRRGIWLVVANRMNKGSPVNDQIINSVGLQAVRTCASGMWTGLTSPSRPWFKWDIALPWMTLDAEGKEWLEDTTNRVGTVLHQSNFYDTMAQTFKDEVVIGTSPVMVYEDAEDVIRLYSYVAGEYYLGVGGRYSTDTLLPEFVMTTLQLVDRFQLKNCPREVQLAWQNGGAELDREWVVCYCIEPNYAISDRKGGEVKILPGVFTWREIYWLRGNKTAKPLSVTGFHEQPFAVFKWGSVSNDAYGFAPTMDCLGDNKQIQSEEYRKAEFIEKGVRPPMGASVDLKNEPSSILPAKITYFNTDGGPRKGFFPLFEVAAQWAGVLTQDIEAVAKRIQSCLYVDLFMAISRMEGVQPRNELELTKRDLERLQELGPVISLNEGQLSIVLNRVYAIMQRRRILKPLPKSLVGVPLKIKYTSIMRLAQIAAEAVAMKDVFATAGALSSAAKAAGVADPIRVLDLDKALKHYAELNNYPSSCVFTDDQVKQHDMIRAQEQQKAQVPGQAMAAVSAAKTLSDTQVPGGNALNSLLTGSTGQGGAA